jgi:hypothetical protein
VLEIAIYRVGLLEIGVYGKRGRSCFFYAKLNMGKSTERQVIKVELSL